MDAVGMAESFLASAGANIMVDIWLLTLNAKLDIIKGVIIQKAQKKASKGGVDGEEVLLYVRLKMA